MPKIWSDTVESHRSAVREAILETTAALAAERGMASVTMSRIAEETGIGRATLYKYFADVEAIMTAWHQRRIDDHLQQLTHLATGPGRPGERLRAALNAYAHISRARHDAELSALLHRDEHVSAARQQLRDFFARLLREAADAGDVRADIAPGELADYCLHALSAAATARSKAAADRLVKVVLSGLAPAR